MAFKPAPRPPGGPNPRGATSPSPLGFFFCFSSFPKKKMVYTKKLFFQGGAGDRSPPPATGEETAAPIQGGGVKLGAPPNTCEGTCYSQQLQPPLSSRTRTLRGDGGGVCTAVRAGGGPQPAAPPRDSRGHKNFIPATATCKTPQGPPGPPAAKGRGGRSVTPPAPMKCAFLGKRGRGAGAGGGSSFTARRPWASLEQISCRGRRAAACWPAWPWTRPYWTLAATGPAWPARSPSRCGRRCGR